MRFRDGTTWRDVDERYWPPASAYHESRYRERYRWACAFRYLPALTERQTAVLLARRSGATYQAIAERLGVSRERVRQMCDWALCQSVKLRRADKSALRNLKAESTTYFGSRRLTRLAIAAGDIAAAFQRPNA